MNISRIFTQSIVILLLLRSPDGAQAAKTVRVASLNPATSSLYDTTRQVFKSINRASIFGGQLTKGTISIFNAQGKEIGSIRTGIGFMATDPLGNLYLSVVNQYAEDIKIYAPPYTQSPQLVHIPGQLVGGIAVDQKTGVFAVMSQTASQGGGASQMNFFRHGESKACKVIHQPAGVVGFGNFLAFDREGNLFFAIDKSGFLHMASIGGQCGADTIQNYRSQKSGFGNLAFNMQDQLVVQQYAGNNSYPIYTYAHPERGSLGAPIATTVLPTVKGFVPSFETLANDGKHLLANFDSRSIGIYDYPQGGPPIRAIPVYNVIYATVFPALDP